jgi:hypothetical protein
MREVIEQIVAFPQGVDNRNTFGGPALREVVLVE